MNVAEALQNEIKRVRDEVLPHYTAEVNGHFAAGMMMASLDRAVKALAEQDAAACVRALEDLRGWNA